MSCPFLRETEVRYCEIAPFRKMIPREAHPAEPERCSTPDYMLCPWAGSRSGLPAGALRCPFLREAMVQYCGAAPVIRFIPHSDALHSFCQNEGHRYCDLYRGLADAGGAADAAADAAGGAQGGAGDGRPSPAGGAGASGPAAAGAPSHDAGAIAEPAGLARARNHMWLDLRPDGSWHLGLDAFFGEVMGHLDALTLTSRPGLSRPAVMATVGGVGLPMVFPAPLEIVALNAALRSDPDRVVRDPYRSGWMYAGRFSEDGGSVPGPGPAAWLLTGDAARRWMTEERERLDHFVREQSDEADGFASRHDGGAVRTPIAPHLAPEERLRLFQEFFSTRRGQEIP